ncbi:hypothetical protein [Pseudomonas sp. CGJS7]|uniref:hypothetical protein n=1 Tax=Pseudomonas sp. CGJS7 TaxID=3109348 RepID=UPI00300B8D78
MEGTSHSRLLTAALIGTAALLPACKREAPTAPAQNPPAATAPAATPAKPPAQHLDPAQLQAIARQVMDQQYGKDNYDAAHRCWKFTSELADDGGNYCMRAQGVQQIEVDGQQQVYAFAANAVDIDQPEYLYGHPSPGLMGAFQLALADDGSWRLLAGDKAMTFGSNGNCGCEDAKLIRIGAQRYAWHFSSGGVWQGIVVGSYSLIAPVDGKMLDLSDIPRMTEDDQDSEYTLVADDSDTSKAFFPLRVTKTTQIADGKSKQSEQVVAFDVSKQTYALPEAD